MADPKRIINRFRTAIKSYGASEVVDLDVKFFEKFDFLTIRLEDVFRVSRTVPPNKWSFHRIGIITQGTGEFQTGVYKIPARKYTLVTVPARVMTSSKGWSRDVKGLLLLFNSHFLHRHSITFKAALTKKTLSPYVKPYIHLDEKQANRLISIFESLIQEQSEVPKYGEELIALKVLEMLIECERLYTETGNLSNDVSVNQVVASFTRLLEENFHEHHTVSYYASHLNVHPNYLNALIKKNTGQTVKQAINNRLVIEVKFLLHSTTLSIKEIAYNTGFKDPNYLTSFFRGKEQISPVEYRSSVALKTSAKI
jgi:AraC family transcriptional regulator, transcriptional activator of pobA